MCSATTYSNRMREIISNIETDIKDINLELMRLNKEQEDVLHAIEAGGFNAVEGYKLAKMIQNIRTQRRDKKNELQTLEILKNNFTNQVSDKLDKLTELVLQVQQTQMEASGGKKYKPRAFNTINIKELLCV